MGLPAMEFEDLANTESKRNPRFGRIIGFNPNTYPKTTFEECNEDERAEYARAIIKCCVLGRGHLPVHSSNPTPMFFLYQAVFEDMLQDPELTPDFKEKLYDFGCVSSLTDVPTPSVAKKLAARDDEND